MTTKYGTEELKKAYGPVTFGNALEAFRKSEEMSLKGFALILTISPQSLCDIEKGRRVPSPKRAATLAKKLKQPEAYWIQLALQDTLIKDQLNYTVSVA